MTSDTIDTIDALSADPTPTAVKAARKRACLSQAGAAATIGLGSPQRWSEFENGHARIDPARWMLFLLLTDQHPSFVVKERA
jgi:hypothetical protein